MRPGRMDVHGGVDSEWALGLWVGDGGGAAIS